MGASADTVGKGVAELKAGLVADGRVRAKGAGRPAAERRDPGVWAALDALVDPLTRGDPMSPLRWTTKSTVKLADALTQRGHRVGGPRLQPAGQRQEARGGPAPGPRRPVRLPERPGQRHLQIDERLRQSTVKLAAAGLALAATLWLCDAPVAHLFEGWQRLRDVATLALLAAIGGSVYGGIVLALFGSRWLAAFRARRRG